MSGVYRGEGETDLFRGSNPADLFKGMAGAYICEARNSGGIDPYIRGIRGQGRVPVTVEGAEQAIWVSRGYAGTNNRNDIDPMMLSGIRVEKAPLLARGMENSVGGGVALTTLSAEGILLPGRSFGAGIRLEAGNNAARRSDPLKTLAGTPVPPDVWSAEDYQTIRPKTGRFDGFGHNQVCHVAPAGIRLRIGRWFGPIKKRLK